MTNQSVDTILKEGQQILAELGRANRKNLKAKITWTEMFGRRTIASEEEALHQLLSGMREYALHNLTQQGLLAEQAGSDQRATAYLSVIQSQKQTIESMVLTLIDTISNHRSELDSKIGNMLMTSASLLALLSVLVSMISVLSR